jgi:hypothetical protein
MTDIEMVDALLRLIEIVLSWPVVLLIAVWLVRRDLPGVLNTLADRITKLRAPGVHVEFLQQIQKDVKTISEKVDRIESVVTFKESPELSPELKKQIVSALEDYQKFLNSLRYEIKPKSPKPTVEIIAADLGASYDPGNNVVSISKSFVVDPYFALHELHASRASEWRQEP